MTTLELACPPLSSFGIPQQSTCRLGPLSVPGLHQEVHSHGFSTERYKYDMSVHSSTETQNLKPSYSFFGPL